MLENLFNIEAEQHLLGTILYDPECAELAAQLHPSDFSTPEHCEIFEWLRKEVDAGRKPTAMAIRPVLGNMRVGPINGAVYLSRLASMRDRTTVRESLAAVKGLSARRQMVGVAGFLQEQANDANALPRTVALEAIEGLDAAIAAERKASPAAQLVFEAARDLVDTLGDPDDGSMIPTGLNSLDAFTGGWPRGELSIIAGRPSMGKSALLCALARRAARKQINLMMFSLEMPRRAIAARMLSDWCFSSREDLRVHYSDILKKRLGSSQRQRLASALEAFRNYQIRIEDQRGLTMPEIQLRAMRYAEELECNGHRLDAVLVDHIGKIRSSDRYSGNLVAETGEKSDALMCMAYDLEIAVIAAHQLNRGTEGREDKHPTPADLRNSGDLEQDTSMLIFPYRQSYYLERQKFDDPEKERIRQRTLENKRNVLELLVSKSRNGACGTVEVFVDMPSNHVEDLRNAA